MTTPRPHAERDALRAALIEAEAGLEFAAAQLPQTTDFVPAHVAALQIVRAALSTAAAHPPAHQRAIEKAELLDDLLNRRPAMNAGLAEAYAKWTQEAYDLMGAMAHVFASDDAGAQPALPPGWVAVPVEPTPEMRKAAADAWLDCGSKMILNKAAAALAAGIAASPKYREIA